MEKKGETGPVIERVYRKRIGTQVTSTDSQKQRCLSLTARLPLLSSCETAESSSADIAANYRMTDESEQGLGREKGLHSHFRWSGASPQTPVRSIATYLLPFPPRVYFPLISTTDLCFYAFHLFIIMCHLEEHFAVMILNAYAANIEEEEGDDTRSTRDTFILWSSRRGNMATIKTRSGRHISSLIACLLIPNRS